MEPAGKSEKEPTCLLERLADPLKGVISLVGSSIAGLFSDQLDHPLKRAVWLLVVVPAVVVKLVVDGGCLLLDEVLFPQAKRIKIIQPVFVVGPPRSGTTFLHRVLAADRERFVTAPAWEVLLAPSILQKKFFRTILVLDRNIGRPLVRGVRRVEKHLLSSFEDTHPGSLADPEEDYYYLSSICACTGWILAFPAWRHLYHWMPGQTESSARRRRRALEFYRRCLQKQLYVDGERRTLLSKNASFSSWMDLLPEVFPDARFVVCMRTPVKTVPSMLSTADASNSGAFATAGPHRLQDLLLAEMRAHYTCLHETIPELVPSRAVVVNQPDLKTDLERVVRTCANQLSLELSSEFWQTLGEISTTSRSHTSTHSYDLVDYGLSEEDLLTTCPTLDATPYHD